MKKEIFEKIKKRYEETPWEKATPEDLEPVLIGEDMKSLIDHIDEWLIFKETK